MRRPRTAEEASAIRDAPAANGGSGGSGGFRRKDGDRLAAPRFQERYPAVPPSAGAVRKALTRFARECGIAQPTIEAIALAASEAVTNVVVHAYSDAPEPAGVEVTAVLAADELWVMVTDAGSGLRPRRDSPGLGLGLAIIARVADGVDLVEPSDGGLEVRMRFALAEDCA
jgi:anti-sigma regulatory factor (Ser/Thr protein kinase)